MLNLIAINSNFIFLVLVIILKGIFIILKYLIINISKKVIMNFSPIFTYFILIIYK